MTIDDLLGFDSLKSIVDTLETLTQVEAIKIWTAIRKWNGRHNVSICNLSQLLIDLSRIDLHAVKDDPITGALDSIRPHLIVSKHF